jgi:hypothetical protein
MGPTDDSGLSFIVRYDANGDEIMDGGAEVSFVRIQGVTKAFSHILLGLPAEGLWKVAACRSP